MHIELDCFGSGARTGVANVHAHFRKLIRAKLWVASLSARCIRTGCRRGRIRRGTTGPSGPGARGNVRGRRPEGLASAAQHGGDGIAAFFSGEPGFQENGENARRTTCPSTIPCTGVEYNCPCAGFRAGHGVNQIRRHGDCLLQRRRRRRRALRRPAILRRKTVPVP